MDIPSAAEMEKDKDAGAPSSVRGRCTCYVLPVLVSLLVSGLIIFLDSPSTDSAAMGSRAPPPPPRGVGDRASEPVRAGDDGPVDAALACAGRHEKCATWALTECENVSFLHTECPRSCGLCEALDEAALTSQPVSAEKLRHLRELRNPACHEKDDAGCSDAS
ncbi:hypothetical protein T492DRAFT_833269 [Pavlovales sp. CCMP2436]|nr:hypothetical protein T492DRAFT_833269 [Pavlovales sp. CCMP2436]